MDDNNIIFEKDIERLKEMVKQEINDYTILYKKLEDIKDGDINNSSGFEILNNAKKLVKEIIETHTNTYMFSELASPEAGNDFVDILLEEMKKTKDIIKDKQQELNKFIPFRNRQ